MQDDIAFSGEVKVDDLMESCGGLDAGIHNDRQQLSKAVEQIDDRVHEVANWVKSLGLIPIFIGGGHNNCYPLLRAFGHKKPIDCINIDAHTDLRAALGRHSGNGFHHALKNGFLNHYAMLGINENYLSESMIRLIEGSSNLGYKNLQELKADPAATIKYALQQIDTAHFALEIDMDVVQDFPSSAQSPVGISLDQLFETVESIVNNAISNPRYIHICEAAPSYGYPGQVGKVLAHLVSRL